MPEPDLDRPLRIFLEPSDYWAENLGDLAMFEVAIRRLRERWPSASISIHSLVPDLHLAIDPSLRVIDPTGAVAWTFETWIADCAPAAIAAAVIEAGRRIRRRRPRLASVLSRLALTLRGRRSASLHAYLDCIAGADLVLMSGGGSLNDTYRRVAFRQLEMLELAKDSGAVAALVSQGLGPMHDPLLRRRAAVVFPRVDLLVLREGVAGPALLAEMGISVNPAEVTGDDAIEPAFAARAEELGTGIGVNLRVASYSGVSGALFEAVRRVVHEASGRHRSPLVPIATCGHDLETLRALIGTEDTGGDRAQVLDRIRQCRIVVAGSYHAAVFALSMGIPVVVIAAAEYYQDKFRGLARQFGEGCSVVSAWQPDFEPRLTAAIDRAWRDAEALRNGLLQAATTQIERSRNGYRRLFDLVEQRRTVRNRLADRGGASEERPAGEARPRGA